MSEGEKDKDKPRVVPRKKPSVEKQKEPEERILLEPDFVLKSEKGTEYLVESLLGRGGMGEVWKVSLLKEPEKRFAMKIEANNVPQDKKALQRLKIEVNLFSEIQKPNNKIDKNHFVRMHDRGKTFEFKYIVMDLIWASLKDIREKVCGGSFSPHALIQISRQTLKGIEALHEMGFLHRDIKPHNFAVGLPPKENIVYTLDFGIARAYRDKDGNVRMARKTVKFMGTMFFASLESLCMKEQARRDDLETWMYMMLDFYDPLNLPWCYVENDEIQQHVNLRMELLQTSRDLLASGKLKVPEKWCDIIDQLNGMGYEEPGDFPQINLILNQICVDENIDENLPLDWLGKKPKSPEKPKREEKKVIEKKEKKKEAVRKKKTAEKAPEVEKPPEKPVEAEKKKRRKSSTAGEESGAEETEEEDDDYEAYLRWKKRRRSRKKQSKNKRSSNDHSEPRKPRRPRRKASNEKNKDGKGVEEEQGGKDGGVKTPDSKEAQEDKKAPTPEKKESAEEAKEKKAKEKPKQEEKKQRKLKSFEEQPERKIEGKKKKDEKPIEKPVVKPLPPEQKKAADFVPPAARKSDGRKS